MKKICVLAALAIPAGVSSVAHAQSSVTLYGIIDAGIAYTNNQAGHANYQTVSGINQGNRWGLKGVEDLGEGLKAIFVLENGFNSFNGTLQQGSREFGRQAYVGLSSTRYGAVTMGRQYDSVVDYLQPYIATGGIQSTHPGDMDNFDNSYRINNSIKYASPIISGFKFGGLASLGGVAGDFANQSVYSAGVNYTGGPFSAGAAWLHVNRPALATSDGWYSASNVIDGTYGANASAYQVIGAGASYRLEKFQFKANYSNVTFDNGSGGKNVKFNNVEGIVNYWFTPSTMSGASYTYTHGSVDATGAVPLYHSFSLILDHFISKRTDVYVMSDYQLARGSAKQAQVSPIQTASSTNKQLVVRIGMSHRF